jgi:hypothetical protein
MQAGVVIETASKSRTSVAGEVFKMRGLQKSPWEEVGAAFRTREGTLQPPDPAELSRL